MKVWVLASLMGVTPLTMEAQTNKSDVIDNKSINETTTEELKAWYESGKKMTVLDARSLQYFDGRLLPFAKWLAYDSSESEIRKTLPETDAFLVVYCWSRHCPASGWLSEKLVKMGYTHITEYREGIEVWMEKDLPVMQL